VRRSAATGPDSDSSMGEGSLRLAQNCFGPTMTGNFGHGAADVVCEQSTRDTLLTPQTSPSLALSIRSAAQTTRRWRRGATLASLVSTLSSPEPRAIVAIPAPRYLCIALCCGVAREVAIRDSRFASFRSRMHRVGSARSAVAWDASHDAPAVVSAASAMVTSPCGALGVDARIGCVSWLRMSSLCHRISESGNSFAGEGEAP